MSRKATIMCDVCGTEMSDYRLKEYSALIKLWPPGQCRSGAEQRIDLCLKCFEKFVNFLESEGDAE